jgi:hypothetical protein
MINENDGYLQLVSPCNVNMGIGKDVDLKNSFSQQISNMGNINSQSRYYQNSTLFPGVQYHHIYPTHGGILATPNKVNNFSCNSNSAHNSAHSSNTATPLQNIYSLPLKNNISRICDFCFDSKGCFYLQKQIDLIPVLSKSQLCSSDDSKKVNSTYDEETKLLLSSVINAIVNILPESLLFFVFLHSKFYLSMSSSSRKLLFSKIDG